MEHSRLFMKQFLKFIKLGNYPLSWEQINEQIKNVSNEAGISNALKLIMTSTGSVTQALEVLSGNEIKVETRFQQVYPINGNSSSLLSFLSLNEGDRLNLREVWLSDDNNKYAFAVSLTPIKRLAPPFKEDLMKADVPIGKLLRKYDLECRREIYQISSINYSHLMDLEFKWDNLSKETKIPYRIYNIICDKSVLMCIMEFFHPKL